MSKSGFRRLTSFPHALPPPARKSSIGLDPIQSNARRRFLVGIPTRSETALRVTRGRAINLCGFARGCASMVGVSLSVSRRREKRKELGERFYREFIAYLSLWVGFCHNDRGRAIRLPAKITDFHGAPSGCDLANVDESSDAPAVGNC